MTKVMIGFELYCVLLMSNSIEIQAADYAVVRAIRNCSGFFNPRKLIDYII